MASGFLNHQITVVGWDDKFSASNFHSAPEGDGAWLCQNSWAEIWGDNGYFWISYYDLSLTQFTGFSAQEAGYYRNYTYNGETWNNAYIRNTDTQLANVFTANGHELLSAVSTYTLAAGTNVIVTIYKNLPENYSCPIQGTKAATLETALDNAGYHTIYLESEIELEPGEIFSVVLELSHESGSLKIPIELNGQTEVPYACKANQSFVNFNAAYDNWRDVQFYDMQNVYIQAFTKCNHQFESTVTQATCFAQGSEHLVCSQCSHSESRILPITDHRFSDWSKYIHDAESGRYISSKSCEMCGLMYSRSYVAGRVIGLDDFIDMLFSRLAEIIKTMLMRI